MPRVPQGHADAGGQWILWSSRTPARWKRCESGNPASSRRCACWDPERRQVPGVPEGHADGSHVLCSRPTGRLVYLGVAFSRYVTRAVTSAVTRAVTSAVTRAVTNAVTRTGVTRAASPCTRQQPWQQRWQRTAHGRAWWMTPAGGSWPRSEHSVRLGSQTVPSSCCWSGTLCRPGNWSAPCSPASNAKTLLDGGLPAVAPVTPASPCFSGFLTSPRMGQQRVVRAVLD